MGFFDWLFGNKNKEIKFNEIPKDWKTVLQNEVPFYVSLSSDEQMEFERRMLRFLNTTKITGIKTSVEDQDRVLIAASAIIPIFAFENWEYHNLQEVLLYPAHFDENFLIGSKSKAILGMVGYGYMEGKMILSKKSLHHGFSNSTDKQNTAIHEFIHLIDKSDGNIDGVLSCFKDKQHILPWVEMMNQKIIEIQQEESDIRTYGATNQAEFLAVAGEYFFERPALLKKKHPMLYKYLEMMFRQPLANRKLKKKARATRHFDPCPCESGKKFRACCSLD